ncbi:MAG: response regulator [Patescibacteria group bacterium]
MHKILIIEDEVSVRKILADKFKKEGFGISEAKDGVEGLKKAKKERPAIILLDIIMPKMDGLTMLKKLRRDEWGKDAKVLVLTNLSDATSVENALEAGVHDFLVKADWKLEDLVKKVKDKIKL